MASLINLLMKSVRSAAKFNPEAQVATACILWPDNDRQWEAVIPHLRFYQTYPQIVRSLSAQLQHFVPEGITYVNWYKKNMMTGGDNPPVGILLCTKKDHALVEYALAGMDNGLFVSKYQLELPKKEEMQRFLEEQIRDAGE